MSDGKPWRYAVTQPALRTHHQQFPRLTTRVASNGRYILAANHPEWYEAASSLEEKLILALNKPALEAIFASYIRRPESTTPLHAYGFAIMALLSQTAQRYYPSDPSVMGAFNSAAATVISNMTNNIFTDPSRLTAKNYSADDLLRWTTNWEAFSAADVFTYRPPEKGKDVDGRVKPIIEVCPAPRLARHLVNTGFEILIQYLQVQEKADFVEPSGA